MRLLSREFLPIRWLQRFMTTPHTLALPATPPITHLQWHGRHTFRSLGGGLQPTTRTRAHTWPHCTGGLGMTAWDHSPDLVATGVSPLVPPHPLPPLVTTSSVALGTGTGNAGPPSPPPHHLTYYRPPHPTTPPSAFTATMTFPATAHAPRTHAAHAHCTLALPPHPAYHTLHAPRHPPTACAGPMPAITCAATILLLLFLPYNALPALLHPFSRTRRLLCAVQHFKTAVRFTTTHARTGFENLRYGTPLPSAIAVQPPPACSACSPPSPAPTYVSPPGTGRAGRSRYTAPRCWTATLRAWPFTCLPATTLPRSCRAHTFPTTAFSGLSHYWHLPTSPPADSLLDLADGTSPSSASPNARLPT